MNHTDVLTNFFTSSYL